MISKLKVDLDLHGLFVENTSEKSVKKLQKGVIRTNCLDSLDRTNVGQAKIGIYMLQKQLEQCFFDLSKIYGP